MSQENVELVRSLQPVPEIDLTELFHRGNEEQADAALAALADRFAPGFVCVFHVLGNDPRPGLRGLREAWLDWLEPWESYRVEIETVSDHGDRVLVLSRDFGRRVGIEAELELKASAVWTVRDGKVERAEFYTERAHALAAVGAGE